MTEQRMHWLRPADYRSIQQATPIAYLPWGAHEWHGAHNALGVDAIKAERICLALAGRTGGVVLPPVYCGHGTMAFHGQRCNFEFPMELVELLARHHFINLRREGFRVIVAVLGHYGWDHVRAIQRMAEQVQADYPRALRVIAQPDHVWTRPEWPGDHAAANETSYMMHFAPESVDLSRLPTVEAAAELDSRREGISGPDPRTEASADRGRRQLELLCERAAPQILAALDEVTPKR